MKRSCKNIRITDPTVIYPWVKMCIERHAKRYDFRKLLLGIGKMHPADYDAAISTHDHTAFDAPAQNIAAEAVQRITERNLQLQPIQYRERIDRSSGKLRQIGSECAMQQIFDYIAVYAAQDVWKRRIVLQQASSIPGRGAIYGVSMIRRWIKRDNRAAAWASRHGTKYMRRRRYFAKLDVRKCYPSLRTDVFMRHFQRDCANSDLLWLWDTLLQSHSVRNYHGFMIGALPSQYACQYLLSFAWRYVNTLGKTRRGERTKLVTHSLFYMDDMLLLSGSRKDLKSAVRKLARYVKTELGLTIKPNWQIQCIDDHPIDMMGYKIHSNGKITIRSRIFVRARRGALRYLRTHKLNLRQARRANSYKGYFMHSDATRIVKRLQLQKYWKSASNTERRRHGNSTVCGRTATYTVHATA